MTKYIQTVLTPLLLMSYVFGLRIIEFPVGRPKVWFSFFYMLLLWTTYFFSLKFVATFYFTNGQYTTYYLMCIGADTLTTLLSIVFGAYHNKKFRNCLKKLDIVDNTLLNIGTTIDYHKLYKKTMCLILGWLLMIILMNCGTIYKTNNKFNYDILTFIYILFMRRYCFYINIINDLVMISILGYVELKFDQVNQHVLNLTKENKCGIKQAWENSGRQHKFPQTLSNEHMTWIVMHLYLELRKISYEINSIFGMQMTLKMGCTFFWLAFTCRQVFNILLINNYVESNQTLSTIMVLIWICYHISNLFFINYICATISTKAKATGNLMNQIPYFTFDVEIRANISQFLLQITQVPVKFYGIGLFQFGYTFFYRCISSIIAVVVLLIQANINKLKF